MPRDRNGIEECAFYPRRIRSRIGRVNVAPQKIEKVTLGFLRGEAEGYIAVGEYLWAGVNGRKDVSSR